ncbi:HAD family hydrolase [Chelatococcus sambhunathii]|uniref:HAD family hydrolase n=1 Tax=Chelatococcus sambhunathii TaxID=363953 RepID=A0ABU1DA91_9HYPH|nr:HAD family hydrolase [Chelatococcus sambhunathii]
MLKPRAVIFDVDGTLVDTVDPHAESWRRAFAAFGRQFGFDEIRRQIGKGGDQLLPVFLSEREVEEEGDRIEAFRADFFKREFLPNVHGFPKVRELFDRLIADGKTIALGSSAKGEELDAYKAAAGIEDLRLVEVSSDDAERSKPHPDIFQAALDRLSLPAADVIVVGDTPYDAEAAAKAGIRMVAVRCGGFDEATLRQAGALEVYDDPGHILASLPPQ